MKRAFALLLLLLFVATSSKGGGLQIVKIDTDHQSFVFSAASGKPLMFRYWGARLSEEDAGAILSACGREKSWELYPAYGGALYTNPALTLVHADLPLSWSFHPVIAGNWMKTGPKRLSCCRIRFCR